MHTRDRKQVGECVGKEKVGGKDALSIKVQEEPKVLMSVFSILMVAIV